MVWNRSGYQDKFSKQQMVFMDKAKKEQDARNKATDDDVRIQKKIVDHLKETGETLTSVEIAEAIGENYKDVFRLLTRFDRKKVELIVRPLNDSGDGSFYRYVGK